MIAKNQLIASALIAGIIVIASSELSLGESMGVNILIINKGEVKPAFLTKRISTNPRNLTEHWF